MNKNALLKGRKCDLVNENFEFDNFIFISYGNG